MTLNNEERLELFNRWYGLDPFNEEVAWNLREKGLMQSREVWRPVKGWEDKYEVSTCGRVRISATGHIMKTKLTNSGYEQVGLRQTINGVRNYKSCSVHRLVAEAFLDNPGGLPEVNHMDECKTNNCLWNLEWCTRKYNHNYKDVQKKKTLHRKGYKTPVEQWTKDGKFVARYGSITEAAAANNLTIGLISRASNGERKTTGGYVWKRV